jgi:hypothetical protein
LRLVRTPSRARSAQPVLQAWFEAVYGPSVLPHLVCFSLLMISFIVLVQTDLWSAE